MRNFVQPGDNLTVPAPEAVVSGGVVIVGDLKGVAAHDADANADVTIATRGVFNVAKDASFFNVGDAVYWDGAAATSTATDNDKIGAATAYADSGAAVVAVKIG